MSLAAVVTAVSDDGDGITDIGRNRRLLRSGDRLG